MLIEEYGISRITLRKVLETLKEEGIIDSNALRELLDSAGVLTFYEVISRIGEIWFEQRTFEDSYEDIQKYLLYSTGNYGNEKTLAIQQARLLHSGHHAKALFIFHIFFPPYKSKMCVLYPWLKKAPFLLPLGWMLRVFKIATSNIPFFRITKAYFTVNYSDSEKLDAITKRLGFSSTMEQTLQ